MFQAEGHDGSLFGSAISNNECHWKWCLAGQRHKKKPENHHLHDYTAAVSKDHAGHTTAKLTLVLTVIFTVT